MKKFSIFLMMLCFACFGVANAQTRAEFLFGDDATSSGNYSPYGGYYGYEYWVYLYDAADVNFSGTITAVSFKRSSSSEASDVANYTLYMMDVPSATALASSTTFATYTDGLTPVFTSNGMPAMTQGWNATTLSTTIEHAAGNSIMVMARAEGCSETGGCSKPVYYTSKSNHVWYTRADRNDPGTNATGSLVANLPAIKFTFTPAAGYCAAPTLSPAEYVESDQASLRWTAGGTETDWVLEYGTASDFTGATSVNRHGIPALAISDLTPSSTYYARVKADCGNGNESDWSNVISFNTPCETITITESWNENFNSLTAGIPNCWDNSEGTTTTESYKWNYYATGHDGAGLRFNSYSNSSNNTNFLKTPTLNFATGKVMQLTFWYKNPTGGDFSVYISTDGGSTYTTALATGLTGVSDWTQEEIALTNYVDAENVVIVFKGTSNWGSGDAYIYLDDVVVENVPSCLKPKNLALATDGTTVTATWTDAANANIDINGTVTNNVSSPYTFNVELSTTYTVKVQGNCGNNDFSDWTDAVSITTPDCIGGHTINYTLNDSYGDGWTGSTISAILVVDGCGNTETLTLPSGTSTDSGTLTLCGSYYQIIWQAGQYPGECSFTLSDNGTVLYSNQAGSGLTDGQVLYTIGTLVPAPTNLTAGTPGMNSVVLNWTAGGSETSWQICVNGDESNLITANTNVDYTLSNLDLDTEYTVKVRAYINANSQSCWSDAVNFTTEASNCPKPTNVTASNLTINSAHISWNGEADSYNVQYATATVTGTTLEEVFFDDFENGFGNWTTYALGDYTDDTWALTNSTSLVDNYHSGSYGALTRSYYNATDVCVDNWLVSPQMTLGDVLKFWVIGDNNNYQEYFAVYVSTGTNATGDFVMVEAPELAPGNGTWAERTVDLSAYAGQQGYIAIRHTDCAQDFLILDDFGVYKTVNAYSYGTFTTLPPMTGTSCDITGLSPETLYVAQVQADCGDSDGTSGWNSVYFTTPDACSAPTDLVSSNVTATTATLAWSDNQDSYNVQYRKVYFFEGFEGETLPTGWTTIDANEDGNTWGIFHATTHSGNNGAANLSYIYSSDGSINTTPDDYLVSPQLDLQGTLRVWLSGITTSTYAEHFEILLSTTGNSASDFTTTLVAEAVTTNEYVEYTADLSSYAGRQGYIAIHHFNCQDQRYLYVDDFGLYGSENWVSVTPSPTDATTTLTGLTPTIENRNHYLPTTYEWQVQGIDCDGNGGTTDWSAPATFTTPEGYVKEITGYGTGTGNWYLISSPIGSISNSDLEKKVINIFSNSYDLFYFDQAKENEWVNHKPGQGSSASGFGIEKGKGYLYANSNDVDLVFTGSAYTTTDGKETVQLAYTNTADGYVVDLPGWNLVGNPFAEKAYLEGNRGFYTMDGDGNFTPVTNASIESMEGIFVVAEGSNESVTFTTSEPTKGGNLALNLSNGRKAIDRAIVRFDGGRQLPKLQLFGERTKLYIPVEGQDYAIVSGEEMGELPVNFKAEENGTYSLSLSSEAVSFAYLHLIDNMTGADVDLLETPRYSFEAKTTDYASRFKLVFATGNASDDNFAFFSNGSFVINNEGNAELQVIDIMGRIVKSESINGCANVNVNGAAGVYMLRLVNGDNVKVQKVVVK